MVRSWDKFALLEDSSWATIKTRTLLGDIAKASYLSSISPGSNSDNMLEYLEVPWSLLNVVNRDVAYLEKSGYNLFTLLRLGNLFAQAHPVSSQIKPCGKYN